MTSYTLANVLNLEPLPNEPISYRDLVLRRKYNTSKFKISKDGELQAEVEAGGFETVDDLHRFLDQLSDQVDPEQTPIQPQTVATDGGVSTANREWSFSISTGTAFLGVAILLFVSAGTDVVSLSAIVQGIAGVLCLGVGMKLRSRE